MNKTYSKMLCRTILLSSILMAGSASAGQADTFAILGQSGITDVYRCAIVADVDTSPISGTALLLSCEEVSGDLYTVDAACPLPCSVNDATFLTAAVGDMSYVYDDAAAGPLNQADATRGTLEGDAQAKNISWQVAGATTLGTCEF